MRVIDTEPEYDKGLVDEIAALIGLDKKEAEQLHKLIQKSLDDRISDIDFVDIVMEQPEAVRKAFEQYNNED